MIITGYWTLLPLDLQTALQIGTIIIIWLTDEETEAQPKSHKLWRGRVLHLNSQALKFILNQTLYHLSSLVGVGGGHVSN